MTLAAHENAGCISGGRVAAHHDVGIAALLEVRIEDCYAGRAPAPPGYLGEIRGSPRIHLMMCYSKSLKCKQENVRPQPLSLRQHAQSGHSFSGACRRPEWRRMRAFSAICPNHEYRPVGYFGPFSASLRTLSLTQPNHARFGTAVESSIIQEVDGRPEGCGFEKPPLRRGEHVSNTLVQLLTSCVHLLYLACIDQNRIADRCSLT
jgi:hypothetical protein